MIELKSSWKSFADRQKWAARGAAFAAKVKATKAVWIPPKPAAAGKQAGKTARKSSKRATKKTVGATKKTTNGTK